MSSEPANNNAASVEADLPTLFFLHALGGSAQSWDLVRERLPEYECHAIDLSGFGDARDDDRLTVEQMADAVEAAIRAVAPVRWLLVGHSMGGKVATVLTARSERGGMPSGLLGTILLAASPPAPEPIDDARRADMLSWVADGPIGEEHARTFVTANIAGDLQDRSFAAAVADVRRAAPDAWHAWLTRGSREDWSRRVGTLDTPALIVAGGEDGDLGEAAQRDLNVPHYRNHDFAMVEGAAHLLPLEAPDRVAELIREHVDRVRMPGLSTGYAAILASHRTSAKTRAILAKRGRADDPDYAPAALDEAQLRTLRALTERIVPDAGIDLAARIDTALANEEGDGWRFADLPPDAEAYRTGLTLLTDEGFDDADASERDALLERLAAGDLPGGGWSGSQAQQWFEDVRSDAVRLWMSDPKTMARIGYDGVANGGDGLRKQGFHRTAADTREAWEPRP